MIRTFLEWLEAKLGSNEHESDEEKLTATEPPEKEVPITQQTPLVMTKRGGMVGDVIPDVSKTGLGTTAMDYNTRVARGKGVEEKIKQALKDQHGIEIRDSKVGEERTLDKRITDDVDDGIDGYWNGRDSVQIKYRDTGKDILFELIKPHKAEMPILPHSDEKPLGGQSPGRDYISKAMYHVVLLPNAQRTAYSVLKVKSKHVRGLINRAINELGEPRNVSKYPNGVLYRPFTSAMGITLNPTMDRRTGTAKVVAFVPVVALKALGEVTKEYPVNIAV